MKKSFYILLSLAPIFLGCEKIEQGIEYGPEGTRQFGTETAIIQELTFPSDEFTIVGDLRSPAEGDKHPVILMIHGSGGATRNGAVPFVPMIACDGGSEEDVATVEQYWAIMNKAVSYEEYRTAAQIVLDIPGVYERTGLVLSDEQQWAPWPRDIDAFFDPVEVLKRTTIPVLAFFGELDKNIDPVQGARAYESALASAGNQDYQVQTIEGAGHVMVEVATGCLGEFVGREYMSEYLETLEFWLMDR